MPRSLLHLLPVVLAGVAAASLEAVAHAARPQEVLVSPGRLGPEGGGGSVVGVLADELKWFGRGGPAGHHSAGPCESARGMSLAFLMASALVLVAIARLRAHVEHRRLQVVQTMLERGLDVPRDLLTAPWEADRRKGIVLVFAALGCLVAGLVASSRGLQVAGLVPGFIGLGYLASHRLAVRDRGRAGTSRGRDE